MEKSGKILTVNPTARLEGAILAPPSKSYTHRAVIIAGMGGRATVINPLTCDDTTNTVAMMRKLGASIREVNGNFDVRGCKGRPVPKGARVEAGESGTLLRFILPVLALGRGRIEIVGRGSLLNRPNRQVVDVLRSWGVEVSGRGENHCLPINMLATGSLKGGRAVIEGSVTSQVVSALLIAAPYADEDTVLEIPRRLVSRPYVAITLDVLAMSGIRVERRGYRYFKIRSGQKPRPGTKYVVHGDYSSAAFPMVAAALMSSDVVIRDLAGDCQGDRRIVSILRRMGAKIETRGDSVRIKGPFVLKGTDIDCSDTPDLVPVLTVLGCFAEGRTRISNVAHLAHKESNRLIAPAEELRKLGADVRTEGSGIVVRKSKLSAGSASGRNDHRIAMSLAVAGLAAGIRVNIAGPECIAKSYPGFVADMKTLGANLSVSR